MSLCKFKVEKAKELAATNMPKDTNDAEKLYFVLGYMMAIEQTNALELLEALIGIMKTKPLGFNNVYTELAKKSIKKSTE
jgi:hypothetical protein